MRKHEARHRSGLTLNFSQPINRSNPLTRGLVSRYKMFPHWRGAMRDIAGHNHGVLTGGALPSGNLGRRGGHGSVFFEGSDDRVVLAAPFSVAAGVTHIAWIRPGSVAGGDRAIRSNKKTIFEQNGAVTRWFPDTDTTVVAGTGFTLAVGEWAFVAITQVGTSYAFYYNGLPMNSGTTVALDDGATAFHIGSFGAAFFYNGYIDDVIDFNRALSPSEIQGWYRATSGGVDPTLNYIQPATVFDVGGGGGGGSILAQMLHNGLFVGSAA